MLVISKALAAQNYEALNEFVDKRAIKVLKHRVDQLTPEQREFLIIKPENFIVGISKMQVIKTTGNFIKEIRSSFFILCNFILDKNEIILQITTVALYSNCETIQLVLPIFEVKNKFESLFKCAYTFQRRYRKGIGDSWIAKLISHGM